MSRIAWLGALAGAIAMHGLAASVSAQGEPEIITEPPAQAPEPSEPLPLEPAFAQPPSEPSKPTEPLGHLRVGGGFGLGFATDFISVGIAPQVSYIFKRIIEPGVAFSYAFSRDRFAVPEVKWNTLGGSLFVRLYPIQPLFFLVEGEVINTGAKQGGISTGRQTYGNLLLGGGFLMGVGRGVFMGMSLKIAVFRNPFYPDVFPILSAGGGYAF